MSNGFSIEQMMDLIMNRLDGLDEKQDKLLAEITAINAHGCAHRPDDLRRLDDLEAWRNRGIVGIIVLAVGLAVDFIVGANR